MEGLPRRVRPGIHRILPRLRQHRPSRRRHCRRIRFPASADRHGRLQRSSRPRHRVPGPYDEDVRPRLRYERPQPVGEGQPRGHVGHQPHRLLQADDPFLSGCEGSRREADLYRHSVQHERVQVRLVPPRASRHRRRHGARHSARSLRQRLAGYRVRPRPYRRPLAGQGGQHLPASQRSWHRPRRRPGQPAHRQADRHRS